VLTAFVRNGKTIRMESRGQLLYARIWYFLYPARRFRIRQTVRMKRLAKKILRALHLYNKQK
jgi:hypothetical protein